MIENYEQLANAEPISNSSFFVVSKRLVEEYGKGNILRLKDLTKKSFVVMSAEQIEALKKTARRKEVLRANARKGGRKRLPDLTPEQIELLPKEEKLRYRMRIWKRESRERAKIRQD